MRCDEECNTFACDFDGGDCSLGINPWRNCSASINCWEVFGDGICNEECNNPACLFDGRDCEQKVAPCNPLFDSYCKKHYANGFCDYGCNNAGCNWDGLDCETSKEPPKTAAGMLSVVLLMDLMAFREVKLQFLRDLGMQLRTTVRVKTDKNGHEMIFPWKGNAIAPNFDTLQRKYNMAFSESIGQTGIQVYLEIDNTRCMSMEDSECFEDVNVAAEYLAATASKHSISHNFPIYQVRGVLTPDDDPTTQSNTKYFWLGFFLIVIVCSIFGVLIQTQRKRAHGVTWFPEGFFPSASSNRTHTRRRADGQEMRNFDKNGSLACIDSDMNSAHMGHSQQWSDDESEMPQPKRMRPMDHGYSSDHTGITDYEEAEPRVWSQSHLDVADIRLPQAMMTPPTHHDGKIDVDVRGPCGMTPLMVAAVRGGGIDTGEDIEITEDRTAEIISELVAQGAELNATMDKTGETSLHLAARYARADAAKRLLDAGAEANCQDNTGRTPLHAAVAADAMGVFQILLRNRATNLNARMHDGTTPLILAARLAIEGMVEDLINADADINAADNAGKTALHWAAAVNNTEAVNVLLVHGANRDAQDDKDETPLFLAAREGSFEAAKTLLDNFANREITDHMDRLPLDVASERLHHDIVRLLNEHVPRSPQMMTVIPNSQIIGSPTHAHTMITHPTVITTKQTKAKKRQKTAAGGANPTSPDGDGNGNLRRKASVKKQQSSAKNNNNNGHHGTKNGQTLLSPQEMQFSEEALNSVESNMNNIPSPYDSASMYSNAMATSQHHLEIVGTKKPPSYEDCIKVSQNVPNSCLKTLKNFFSITECSINSITAQYRQLRVLTRSVSGDDDATTRRTSQCP